MVEYKEVIALLGNDEESKRVKELLEMSGINYRKCEPSGWMALEIGTSKVPIVIVTFPSIYQESIVLRGYGEIKEFLEREVLRKRVDKSKGYLRLLKMYMKGIVYK